MMEFAKRSSYLMWVFVAVAVLAGGESVVLGEAEKSDRDLIIWDDKPAEEWDIAYPVGNGSLGAMPFGSFPQEKILINEETIWHRSNDEKFLMPEDSYRHLEEIKKLDAKGEYQKADKYFEKHLQKNASPDSYQLLGWLKIDYRDTAPPQSRHRELDLKTGIAKNIYELEDGTIITQKVFASAPADVIGVRISANREIDFDVTIDGGEIENGDLVKRGSATGQDATRYIGRARVVPAGKVKSSDKALKISNVKKTTIYLAAATDFNRENAQEKLPEGWQTQAVRDLDKAESKSYDAMEKAAVGDHRRYFDRVDIDLGSTPAEILSMPTPKRLERIKSGEKDPDLIETYFQFGRYLLIASSRPGALPANLQGIWNPHMKAPWGSDYHLNINIQMNYWPAETTNLSEMHRPFFKLIELFQPTGREMADRLGMEGWCMPHATDVWGHAHIMSKTAFWGGSFFGGQWMTTHILEHYRFTRNRDFLENYWGILTASSKFVASWLIPGPKEGQLMARPSCSPENSFQYKGEDGKYRKAALSAGNSFDQFMVLQVFNDYLEAAKALGREDTDFVQKVQQMLPKVYRPRIAKDGRLMEWRLPFKEDEPGHRHISHVIGAYPGNQIDLDDNRKMRAAVRKTIESRLEHGGAATGWSRAWTIGMFARLSDEQRAYENLLAILKRSTLPNLWDSHPPFQIDGNFGATAAMAEMLMHSHNDEIKLLPALPAEWPEGHVRGLCARGDYTVDISWRKGILAKAVIEAGDNAASNRLPIVYKGETKEIDIAPGESVALDAGDFGSFE